MRSNGPISLSIRVCDQIAQGAAQGGRVTNSLCAPGADHFPRRQFYRHLDYAFNIEIDIHSFIRTIRESILFYLSHYLRTLIS
jgi:hypothetical protein